MTSAHILVVEDEAELATILRDNLELEGYDVETVDTGEQGIDFALKRQTDLILLDVMLPGISGYEVCRRLRAAGFNAPVIMLTVRNSPVDRMAGLDVGGDDYVGKPFDIGELLARVRAHLRRRDRHETLAANRTFSFGTITVNLYRREVKRDGRDIHLSVREFDLLAYLIDHRGEVISREQLLVDVWGYGKDTHTRTVDNFVAKLRSHVEQDQGAPRHIITVHGAGYKFMDG